MQENLDRKDIKKSLYGRMRIPVTAERLAFLLKTPVQLVQAALKELHKRGYVKQVDSATEDGEVRLRWVQTEKWKLR